MSQWWQRTIHDIVQQKVFSGIAALAAIVSIHHGKEPKESIWLLDRPCAIREACLRAQKPSLRYNIEKILAFDHLHTHNFSPVRTKGHTRCRQFGYERRFMGVEAEVWVTCLLLDRESNERSVVGRA